MTKDTLFILLTIERLQKIDCKKWQLEITPHREKMEFTFIEEEFLCIYK